MNKIITVASQKGGCGKSTICTLFANYLSSRKKNVCIIDVDFQQSLIQQRRDEKAVYGEPPYEIKGFEMTKPELMQQLMENAREYDGYVLIDCPGKLDDDGLIPVLIESDYIICPFQFDIKSLTATTNFVNSFQNLQGMYPDSKTRLLFIPNNIKRKGTQEEQQAWRNVGNTFGIAGTVLDPIPYRACIEKVNTYEINSAQLEVVKGVFDKIIKIIKQ